MAESLQAKFRGGYLNRCLQREGPIDTEPFAGEKALKGWRSAIAADGIRMHQRPVWQRK